MGSNDYEKFDGLFTTIASGVNGIEPLMDAFFGFLGRKTDFYQADVKTNQDDPAYRVILKYFEKHRASALKRYKVEKERNRERDETRRKKKETEDDKKLVEFKKNQEKLKNAPRVEEVFDDEIQENIKEKIVKIDSNKEVKSQDTTMKTDDGDDDKEDEESPPIGNGGKTEKYIWSQTLSTVDVLIDIPLGTVARQCKVIMTSNKLKLCIKEDTLIEGDFHDAIKPDDSIWTLEDNKILHLVLEKKERMRWWSCVLKGDPEINTQKIIPENSKISDLDDDLRQTVEKMMYDQEMKARGLPTSSQSQQAAIFESFKKSHPEMDFSQAKINWGGNSM